MVGNLSGSVGGEEMERSALQSRVAVSFSFFYMAKVRKSLQQGKSEFFIDNLLVRIPFITEMIKWTGLTQREFELPFPGSCVSTFLDSSKIFVESTVVHSFQEETKKKEERRSSRVTSQP